MQNRYVIERNGSYVKHVVFIGDSKKSNSRSSKNVVLWFSDETKAKEIASIWDDCKIVQIDTDLEAA